MIIVKLIFLVLVSARIDGTRKISCIQKNLGNGLILGKAKNEREFNQRSSNRQVKSQAVLCILHSIFSDKSLTQNTAVRRGYLSHSSLTTIHITIFTSRLLLYRKNTINTMHNSFLVRLWYNQRPSSFSKVSHAFPPQRWENKETASILSEFFFSEWNWL